MTDKAQDTEKQMQVQLTAQQSYDEEEQYFEADEELESQVSHRSLSSSGAEDIVVPMDGGGFFDIPVPAFTATTPVPGGTTPESQEKMDDAITPRLEGKFFGGVITITNDDDSPDKDGERRAMSTPPTDTLEVMAPMGAQRRMHSADNIERFDPTKLSEGDAIQARTGDGKVVTADVVYIHKRDPSKVMMRTTGTAMSIWVDFEALKRESVVYKRQSQIFQDRVTAHQKTHTGLVDRGSAMLGTDKGKGDLLVKRPMALLSAEEVANARDDEEEDEDTLTDTDEDDDVELSDDGNAGGLRMPTATDSPPLKAVKVKSGKKARSPHARGTPPLLVTIEQAQDDENESNSSIHSPISDSHSVTPPPSPIPEEENGEEEEEDDVVDDLPAPVKPVTLADLLLGGAVVAEETDEKVRTKKGGPKNDKEREEQLEARLAELMPHTLDDWEPIDFEKRSLRSTRPKVQLDETEVGHWTGDLKTVALLTGPLCVVGLVCLALAAMGSLEGKTGMFMFVFGGVLTALYPITCFVFFREKHAAFGPRTMSYAQFEKHMGLLQASRPLMYWQSGTERVKEDLFLYSGWRDVSGPLFKEALFDKHWRIHVELQVQCKFGDEATEKRHNELKKDFRSSVKNRKVNHIVTLTNDHKTLSEWQASGSQDIIVYGNKSIAGVFFSSFWLKIAALFFSLSCYMRTMGKAPGKCSVKVIKEVVCLSQVEYSQRCLPEEADKGFFRYFNRSKSVTRRPLMTHMTPSQRMLL